MLCILPDQILLQQDIRKRKQTYNFYSNENFEFFFPVMLLKNYLQHIIKKKIEISASTEIKMACSGNKGNQMHNQMLQCLHLLKLG